MTSSCVLDSSAVLALVFNEAGADRVLAHSPSAVLSAVSYSECVAKATDRGFPLHDAVRILDSLQFTLAPFDHDTAILACSFRKPTRHLNCSFADRACLATACLRGLPVVTADRNWGRVDLGVEVVLFR